MVKFTRTFLSIFILIAATSAHAVPASFTFGCMVHAVYTQSSCSETSRSDTEVFFSGTAVSGTALTTNAAVSLNGYLRNQVGDIGVFLQMSGYAFDQYYGYGYGLASTSWGDRIQIKSNTLPNGTPVQIDITKRLQAEIYRGASGSRTAYINSHPHLLRSLYAVAYNDIYGPMDTVSMALDFTFDFTETTYSQDRLLNTYVGAFIFLGDSMNAGVSWDFAKPSENSSLAAAFRAGVSAGNSSHVYLSTGQDVNFVTESGHDFALPQSPTGVPEPSTIALLGIGLLALTLFRKRLLGNTSRP